MSKADTVAKIYMKQSSIFADVFNFYLYGGRQVIKPEQLRELDPTELSIPYGKDKKGEPVQRYRDTLKELAAMEDGEGAYLLLGIESQSLVHYAMPVRNLLYDGLQYARQVDETARRHRKEKDYKGRASSEFLSGFYREDRLLPVITLVIFFSPEKWDGPRSLSEMMATKNPEILSLLPEYRIHLLSPADLGKEDFGKFHTSLGDVLEFIKYSEDKEKLSEWLEERRELILGQKEVEVLNACTKAGLRMKEEDEVIEVCKAIQDMKTEVEELTAKRVTKDVTERVTKNVTERVTKDVTKRVTKDVTENTRLLDLKNLMRNMKLTAEQAAAALGIPQAEQASLLKKL